MIIKIILLGRK